MPNSIQHTDGDFDRIGLIKKASDVVYAYVRWVLEDHTKTLVEADHIRKGKQVASDVCDIFGLPAHRCELGTYFCANVLMVAREYEEASTEMKDWTPFSDDSLQDMYNQRGVAFFMNDLSPQDACMYAGTFLSEMTQVHPSLEEIRHGQLVGCDPVFMTTTDWRSLVEQADLDESSTIDVGKALVQLGVMTDGSVVDLLRLGGF